MATETRDVDVIVIGAGVSGLTAAFRLKTLRPECKVLAIEASDRVGGRTHTVDLKAANGTDKWDIGGQWVCRKQHHIIWLLKELGLGTYDQYTKGRKMVQMGDRKKIKTSDSLFGAFSYTCLADLALANRKLEQMVRQVPKDDPRKCAKADEWDSKTLDTLIRSVAWTEGARDVLTFLQGGEAGARAREISALCFLHACSTSGGLDGVSESTEWRIAGGAQQVSEKLAERVDSENVLLSEPVAMIDQSDESEVAVTTKSGKRFTCKYVINTSPILCSVAMDYKPTFPQTRQSLAQRSPLGNSFKFVVTYRTAFWRENGLSGELTRVSKDDGRESGPIFGVIDGMTENDNPALVGFYANSWQWRTVKFEERRDAVLKDLSKFLGPDAEDPLEFIDKDWTEGPFTGGGPGSWCCPGAITTFFDGWKTPLDRVHWAGSETATMWIGFISGAVQSGMRAAEEVLSRIDPGFEGDSLLGELDQKPL